MTQVLASRRSSLCARIPHWRRRPTLVHGATRTEGGDQAPDPRGVGARGTRGQAPLRERADPNRPPRVRDRATGTRVARPRRASAASRSAIAALSHLAMATTETHSSAVGQSGSGALAPLLGGPGASSLEIACADGWSAITWPRPVRRPPLSTCPTRCSTTAPATPACASSKGTRPKCPSRTQRSTWCVPSTPSST